MKRLRLLLFYSFLFFLYGLSHAAFEERYWGARVSGLAGAYGTVSDDGAGVFYNMAKLGTAKDHHLEFGYGQLFAGVNGINLNVSNFGYAQEFDGGVLGLGWGSFGAKDLYREDVVVLGFGSDLRKWIVALEKEIAVGVTARYLMRRFILDARTISDPVFKDGRINSSVAFDLHLYVPVNEIVPGLSAGVSLKSLNRPSVGYVDKEPLVPEVVASMGWKNKIWTIPLDISSQGREITPHFGIELKLLKERFALRVGSDTSQVGSGFGYRHSFNDSVEATLDYSFLWPIHFQKGAGSHRTSVGLRF